MEGWQIVVAIVVALLGSGGIVALILTRRHTLADRRFEIHDSNQAAAISASATLESQFRADLLSRVNSLEKESKEIKEIDRKLAIENAELRKDNQHLNEQNSSHVDTIEKLQEENKMLTGSVKVLEENFRMMRSELTSTTQELNLLKSQYKRFGQDPALEIEKEVLKRIGSIEFNKPKTVLFIDDDQDHLSLFEELLKQTGLQCKYFSNGGEAVEWLRHNYAAVIVVDLAIDKDIDGLTLIEKIRGHERRNRKVPAHIIIYSGFEANEGVKEDARLMNVEAVLRKVTHTPDDVVTLINSLIDSMDTTFSVG